MISKSKYIAGKSVALFILSLSFLLLTRYSSSGETGNTITRNEFNFGHQLGYIYSRFDSATFNPPNSWSFSTGFSAYYTPEMPLVRNPYWEKRLMLAIPLYFEFTPGELISVQFELTDLFVEFPYKNYENMGGKSPRFKTKIRLLEEKRWFPATALTMGVKWSSAKPYTIWHDKFNYDSSNGLAGAGTGVADYLILFTFSKRMDPRLAVHGRIGLAPLGSPVGNGKQADEIPYGLGIQTGFFQKWNLIAEIAGMYNGLPATKLAHYSVVRTMLSYTHGKTGTVLNLEKGLTRSTDQWVAGLYQHFLFKWKQSENTPSSTR